MEHITSHNFQFKAEAQDSFLRCSICCTVNGSCTYKYIMHQTKQHCI